MTQIHVLRQLEQHGTMSMSRIAELLDVSLSNATGIIDRMAERGLVERVRVPDDRRVVLVQPSDLGIQALDETEGIKLDRIRAICDRLDDVQLRRITQAMGDLRGAICRRVRARRRGDASNSSPRDGRRLSRPTTPSRQGKGFMEAFPVDDEADVPSTENDPALVLDRRAKFEILGAILLGLFLAALDQTIVGPVLPRIVTELKGADLYTWVVTIFLVTSTITVPIYGKLSDLYGRRPLLMFGIVLFLIGSALSGLSQTMWQLILFRGHPGPRAGALFPIALAVIGDLFTPGRAGQVPGPLRGRLRDRLPGRPGPRRVPDRHASAGTGSSSSTCRSGSSPWSSSPGSCRTSRAAGATSRSTTSGSSS